MHGRRLGPREASRRVGRVLDAPTVCPAWPLEPVCLGGWQGQGLWRVLPNFLFSLMT